MKAILLISLLIVTISCSNTQKMDNKEANDIVKEIEIFGEAQNAKGGAIIITSQGEVYYLQGLDSWSDQYYGKQVQVAGIIQTEHFNEDDLKDEHGAYTQGMAGDKITILSPKYKLLE